jgi:hypothetical protein
MSLPAPTAPRVLPLAFLLLVAGGLPRGVEAGERGPLVRLTERLERLDDAVEAGFRAQVEPERLAAAGRIELELPGDRLMAVTRSRLEERGRGDLLWSGSSSGDEQVVLTVRGGRLAGTVFGRDGVYQISPVGDDGHELLEVDRGTLPGCGGAPHFDGLEPVARSSATTTSFRTPRIDLLVLYEARTTAAVGSKRNMQTIVQHYVDLTNVALHNSAVEARVRLVHTTEVSFPAGVSGSNEAILGWLRSSAEIADLRGAHGADLVGVVHEPLARFCGSAAMVYRPGGPTSSRAFFDSRRLCGADTFAHEVGHLLGGDHNPENSVVASGQYIYGRGHYHDGLYRTIMSYSDPCSDGCPSQPFFSNPSIRHDRRKTGLPGERDNARIIDEFADAVAGFSAAVNDPGLCALSPGDPDYCLECGPCFAGEGNCESDSECEAGLGCVADSGADFGLGARVGVCQAKAGCELDPGDPDYCLQCGPCGFGEGDCDGTRECQAGLTCVDDVGATFGLAPSADVCGFRQGDFCPYEPGHPDFCRACGPCEPGEGGCKSSGECVAFSQCFEKIGAELGFTPNTNVCLRAAPADCPFQLGDPDYCKVCGVCGEAEGDCDTDRQCRAGLECVDGAGARLGFGDDIDLCLESEGGSDGGAAGLKAPRRLKAKVLSPTRVRLKWKDKSKGEAGFHIEMSLGGARFERIASTGPNKKKFFVDPVESGLTYTFRVQAFDAEGVSDYSSEVTVTTP